MEGYGFSGDFLVTFALSSSTSFSAGVCPDVLSSGCVETSVQAPLRKMQQNTHVMFGVHWKNMPV